MLLPPANARKCAVHRAARARHFADHDQRRAVHRSLRHQRAEPGERRRAARASRAGRRSRSPRRACRAQGRRPSAFRRSHRRWRRPCRSPACGPCRQGPPSSARSGPCTGPATKLTTLALSRWVSGICAAAAAPSAALTPGTTSTGTPAARQASASSPPRPNTNGSPPLSRTTSLPGQRLAHQQRVDRRPAAACAARGAWRPRRAAPWGGPSRGSRDRPARRARSASPPSPAARRAASAGRDRPGLRRRGKRFRSVMAALDMACRWNCAVPDRQ